MYRKSLLTSVFIVSLILAGGIAVSAQTFIVRGTVQVRQADGTTVPVPEAVIDTYRTDMNSKGPTAKANKKGEYSVAGMFYGGTYMLAASGAGAAPKIISDVKGSNQIQYDFVLEAGDGRRMTQEEAFTMFKGGKVAGPTGGGEVKETAEQKKARDDYEKKKAEVDARNSRVQNADKIITAAQKDGIEALKAKNYDLAITKFDEGIQADPEYIEAVAIFRNLKSEAFRSRGFEKHVKWVSSHEDTLKAGAKEDIHNAYDTAKTNLDAILKAPASTDPKEADNMLKNKYNALANMSAALYMMSVNEIDMGKGEDIKTFYPQFLAAETDPIKKEIEQREFADALRKSGECEAAVAEYQKLLDVKADNVDALAGKGLCLVNIGAISDNKDTLQDGLNTLQHFVDVAPDTHKLKTDAKATIEYLKTEQKLAPQKLPKTTPKKKP
jgi:tetratricopeptide (TPR) repeat protein